MHLTATVSASEFDEHYQMALVYCYDTAKRYCFSLSRFPDHEEIEVMVEDQQNHKRLDLCVHLEDQRMTVLLDDPANWSTKREPAYVIDLQLSEGQEPVLHAALRRIFKGKLGLRIGEGPQNRAPKE